MTELPEPGTVEDPDLGLPGPATPQPEHEPDEVTDDDYDEEVEDDG
ncbi:hypothetical protein [Nocardioides zeicaulis]|uniref:Uncharacterized protein n=1 Tax=Nocardioides zeicaulis TaxID=1776857 RepID=A0ABV6DZ57_9ACTN